MTCNRFITYHAAHSEIIYYVTCAHFEFFQDSVPLLSLRCAIELIVYYRVFSCNQKISDLYYYQSAILSRSNERRFCLVHKIGDFVSFSESAILSHFQNRRFCPTLKTAVLSRIRMPRLWNVEIAFHGYFQTLLSGAAEWKKVKESVCFTIGPKNTGYEIGHNGHRISQSLVVQNRDVLLKSSYRQTGWTEHVRTRFHQPRLSRLHP